MTETLRLPTAAVKDARELVVTEQAATDKLGEADVLGGQENTTPALLVWFTFCINML